MQRVCVICCLAVLVPRGHDAAGLHAHSTAALHHKTATRAPCAIHDCITLRLCSGCCSRHTSSSRRLRLRICRQRAVGRSIGKSEFSSWPPPPPPLPPLTSWTPPCPSAAVSAAALHATLRPPRARRDGKAGRGGGTALRRGSVTTRRAAGQAAP